MEVTALPSLLCSSLVSPVMIVLLLLVTQVDFSYSQNAEVNFPQVVPDRQQHFQYESIVVSCEGLEGLTGWRVMRNIRGVVKTCAASWSASTGPCRITTVYPDLDSGEYWCEMGGGKRTNTVNITVTAGSVILDSPVLPVMEGDSVTLSCRKKLTSSNLTAEFFKDGHFMESSSTGNITIHNVSNSHEGLYKCRTSDVGESPESWLAVREAHEEPHPSSHHTPQLYLLLCVGLCVFLVALLMLVGLVRCRKRQTIVTGTATSPSSFQSSSSPQTVSGEARVADPVEPTYALITKPMKEREPRAYSCSATPVPYAGY
ncbi:low affinity immunoglobulin gamma Fc region receptor III-like [Dicentrarchus labrax]|uniref:low affinity immunoglobulin gamma Fc region receptor III-like n=1 Tax=Dicentrarchus labrax TaxID=13489 RepID=UPI0021F59D82|nr:low affinity immunoglobulin gamma Fc region receptor III-like [Dicentrarchus labrax]